MTIKLLLAAAFASSCPAAAAAADAAAPVEARERANERLSLRCGKPGLDIDAILSDASLRADLATCSDDDGRDLVDYVACRALLGASGGCSALEGLAASAGSCAMLSSTDRFVFLVLRGGDALAACRGLFESEGRRGPPIEKGCAAIIEAARAGGPMPSCGTLKSVKFVAPQGSCENYLAFWSGSPRDCDRLKGAEARHVCRDRAALVAGLRDRAKCASSPSCRALVSKSPEACDGLRARSARSLCARVAKDVAASQELRRGIEATRAAVASRAEAEARKAAKAKAQRGSKDRPQFKEGEPMQTTSPEVLERLKAIEEGRPLPPEPDGRDKKEGDPSAR